MGNNKGNSVSVTPVSCQIKILVSVCHLPENFCTLSILTVPLAFLINVSSLILSWLLILPLPTHCTKVKDTVHYYTVTYMLLIWRRLNDLFSYKNIVNSNSQYLALQHVLFIYRDGTMALARTSGQVLANPDNMAVFWSGRKQLELQNTLQLYVYLQIHQPTADRKREWWITSLSELWPLPTMTVHVGIAVLGTDMPKLMKQDLLVSRVSWFVHNQSNCLFTNQLIICKGSSQQVLSVIPYLVLRWEHRSSILWLVYTGMTLSTLRPSLPWIHQVKFSVYGRLGHLK